MHIEKSVLTMTHSPTVGEHEERCDAG